MNMSREFYDPMLRESWGLTPEVAIRQEPFGALAYHFGNRRLTFLKRPELVTVVRRLERCPDVRSAFLEAGVPSGQWKAYVDALRRLASADLIRRTEKGDPR